MNSSHDLFVWRSNPVVSPDVVCPFVYPLVTMLKTRIIWWHDDRKLRRRFTVWYIWIFDTSTHMTSHVTSLVYWGSHRPASTNLSYDAWPGAGPLASLITCSTRCSESSDSNNSWSLSNSRAPLPHPPKFSPCIGSVHKSHYELFKRLKLGVESILVILVCD